MRVLFCGVGEAFDETLPNTSVLIDAETRLLLDCGFSAAPAYFRTAPEPLRLDGVWISHFHADHFLGLPMLLTRLHEEGRSTPLTLIGQAGLEDLVSRTMELAYPALLPRLGYGLRFLEAVPGAGLDLGTLRLSFARGDHSPNAPNLAIRVQGDDRAVLYGGDGRPTPETRALAANATLLIHECYGLEESPGHSSLETCLELAERARCETLALVHLQRRVRREKRGEIWSGIASASMRVFLPEPGDVFEA